eukprot:7151992-Pyramimonas_sp.AAC.1
MADAKGASPSWMGEPFQLTLALHLPHLPEGRSLLSFVDDDDGDDDVHDDGYDDENDDDDD